MNQCNQIGIQDVSELEVLGSTNNPDYVLGVQQILDDNSGNILNTMVKVPYAKIVPTGTNVNMFAIEANNPNLNVPEGQLVPAFVLNTGASNVVTQAGATHPADFLVVAVGESGLAFCQSTGVVTIPSGTDYIIGAQYYLATDGGVTTSSTQTGQKLFKPVSKYQLLINL